MATVCYPSSCLLVDETKEELALRESPAFGSKGQPVSFFEIGYFLQVASQSEKE
jgi:hypothetical protein